VHFTPEVQAKLEQMARDTGSRSDELVKDVVTDFFDEVTFTRQTIGRRYDDLEGGRVQPVSRDELVPTSSKKAQPAAPSVNERVFDLRRPCCRVPGFRVP
jgi:hypothetical protein